MRPRPDVLDYAWAVQFCLATTGSPQVKKAWGAPELPQEPEHKFNGFALVQACLLYTSPSPRD
eukprot:14584370-Alexandrium_andersonii.AAC.1